MKPATYADAGVDIDAANRATEKIREFARRTFNARTLSDIGSFGGMFDGAFPQMRQPVLVASADGVGTKLKVAFDTRVHNTVGRDLVNHCVNDILVQGARPLFFLDYFATGKLEPDVTACVVEGIADGCRENGCVLLGGETAEMPDFYPEGEYDIAGFIVGVVDREQIIDGHTIETGDVILGLPSAGLHTNGYSLARKLFFDVAAFDVDTYLDEVEGTAGAVLLRPHVSYLKTLEGLIDTGKIKGLAHITGGGLLDNIPRILPEATNAEIRRGSWPVLPVFELLQKLGNIEEPEMFRTFNMGIGMVIICDAAHAPLIKSHIEAVGENCYEVGRIVAGDRKVVVDKEVEMADWLQDFKQTIDSASTKLAQIDEGQSGQPRAEDHWSSKQIIGHLIDSATNNHARFVLGQLKDDLVFPGYDQDGWVRTNHYQERAWSDLIQLWRAYNLHLHHLMAHADRAKLDTPCTLHTLQEIAFKTVPKTEPVTLEYLMQDYVDHLKHHLAQILGGAQS